MYLLDERETKLQALEKLVDEIEIKYDIKTHSYHVALPANLIVKVKGDIVIQGQSNLLLFAQQIHLNPPLQFLKESVNKLKKYIPWRTDGSTL